MTTNHADLHKPETFIEQSKRVRGFLKEKIAESATIREAFKLDSSFDAVKGKLLTKSDSLEALHRKAFLHCYDTLDALLVPHIDKKGHYVTPDAEVTEALKAQFTTLRDTLDKLCRGFEKMVPEKGDSAFEMPTEIEPDGTIRRGALALSQRDGFDHGAKTYSAVSRALKKELGSLNLDYSSIAADARALVENMDAIVASLKKEVGKQRSFER